MHVIKKTGSMPIHGQHNNKSPAWGIFSGQVVSVSGGIIFILPLSSRAQRGDPVNNNAK